ncbi:glycosyltransferase [Desulfobulbus sp.]|uniref:glycosyltransferase n=1 Tax=Desulfobulbus sp. TaxID=895 RepID=UPI0027B885F8|nr:glycosyltransferase [Desulfobulbus sp.]
MRIVIDMQGAQTESRFRGIGRYTLSLSKAVVRNQGEHEVILALNGLFPETIEPIRAAFDGLLPQKNIRVWNAPGPIKEEQPGNDDRREVAELIREAFLASLQPDVVHISSLFEGYADDAVTSIGRFDRSTPVSVSLYDLIPLLNPDHYFKSNPTYHQYYRRKLEHLKQAAVHLAISEFSRQEGISHLEANEGQVVNVSTAIDPCFHPLHIDKDVACQLGRQFGLTRPFVLYTGGADERKNLTRLVQAFAALPASLRSSHQLLLAGKIHQANLAPLQHLAQRIGLKPDALCFAGYVTDQELVHLYNLCKLFVFPSWHEGFGLPALEAMACGAPVIGANTSSLPEVIALEAALFDPFDVTAITAKMAESLQDAAFRSRLRNHGLQQAQQFSWDKSANQAIGAWNSLSTFSTPVQPNSQTYNNKKRRLAFVSPLPPERTGIADYSAQLLPALAEHYDIEIVVAQDRVDDPWVNNHGKVWDVSWLRTHADKIDRVLYQIGNSPFHQHMLPLLQEIPGTVVLHDFYMSGLMAWLEQHANAHHPWIKALYAAHGYGAIRERHLDPEAAKRNYPVNLHILQHAQGVIVHSEYSRHLAQQWYKNGFTDNWEVIPLLRSPAAAVDKVAVRQQLNIDKDDFIICSFGFIDATKLNHRLLSCWLNSALAEDSRCRIFFVGGNHDGDYGTSLSQTMSSSGIGDRLCITGYVSPEKFLQYLSAADMAVQLRTQSRGETSAAVLDCMNYGLPLIVNANGAMAELPPDSVWMLPETFNDSALVEALEKLWREPERRRALGECASETIRHHHGPAKCAKRYAEAIERFHRRSETSTTALIEAIAAQKQFVQDDPELILLAKSISSTLPLNSPNNCLFLDVSATFRTDLKTGIERVARALLLALMETPPAGYRIEPVYLSHDGGEWHLRYARRYTVELLGGLPEVLDDEIVEPELGDTLLGLDLSGDILVQAEHTGLFANYRNRGVRVFSVVFDLLPVQMPERFPPDADKTHAQWLQTILKFDGAICISKTVADHFTDWQTEPTNFARENRRPFQIRWFHLGADVLNSSPTYGLPKNSEWTLHRLGASPTFLMVGTIEPRKGYLQAIEAFSQLWKDGLDVNLIIVGKEGWKQLPDEMRRDIPITISFLQNHPELEKHLFWREGISDEYLEKIYSASTCLIAASYGEGFGLPLIEAAQHKLPIIARDIPVFREVAGEHALYFNGSDGADLAVTIQNWLALNEKGMAPQSDLMPWLTWEESARQLSRLLLPQ